MSRRILVLLGTKKGAFALEADADRRDDAAAWSLRGPFCQGWPINHFVADPATESLYAASGSPWFGPTVWRSDDLGGTWTQSSDGFTYGEGEPPVTAVWHVTPGDGVLYAGVEPAGLFRSTDDGRTWTHVEGLTKHPSRPTWQPGAGGLICHTVLLHPDDPDRMWVAISAAGVFATEDGGRNWEPRNRGTRADFMPDQYPETGQCVHKAALAAGRPDRLFQQNHCGTYRSDDSGKSWVCLDEGLPSTFGFPVVAHPRDPDSFFTIPLNGAEKGRFVPDAAMAVWTTSDAGATWRDLRDGLPQKDAYLTVLREGFANDTLDPFGLYFGTTSGEVHASADEGRHWRRIAEELPSILSVETAVVEA